MQTIIIDEKQAGRRLDKFLKLLLPEAGTGFLYKMLRKKNITLNGKKADGTEVLSTGDEVCVFFKEETLALFSGQTNSAAQHDIYEKAYHAITGIEVLYEDADVLLLNKPQGVLSQKAAAEDFSLNEWMLGYLLAKNDMQADRLATFKPSVCNRLDRNTSGIVLCGKSLQGSQALSRMIKEREMIKLYHAIVVGRMEETLSLNGYLTKNARTNKVVYDAKQGEEAIRTNVTPICSGEALSLLEVHLITGKPHQIRAHLASVGHPVLGDNKYGDREANRQWKKKYPAVCGQLLHAYSVTFPDTADALPALRGRTFTAPEPALFESVRKELYGDLEIKRS